MPLNKNVFLKKKKEKKKVCNQKAWNYLQSAAVAKQQWKQLHRGLRKCVCVQRWDWYIQCNQLHSNLGFVTVHTFFLFFFFYLGEGNVCFCPQLVSNLCEPYNCPLKATSERTEMDSNSGGYEANLSRAFYFRVAGGDTATLPFFSLLFSCF